MGYAFVNFVDPYHVVLFYDHYVSKKWIKYRSDKVRLLFNLFFKKIDLNYAEKQGKKDINNKDENTYFACDDKKINGKKAVRIDMPFVRIIIYSIYFIILAFFGVT